MSNLRPILPWLILGGFLFLVLGSGIFLVTAGKGIGQFLFGRSYAEGELREYVGKVLQQEVRGVSCQPYDTDDNGYVSCDYTLATSQNTVSSTECAVWGLAGFINRGCRTRLPNFAKP
jgi:hypothetical protein